MKTRQTKTLLVAGLLTAAGITGRGTAALSGGLLAATPAAKSPTAPAEDRSMFGGTPARNMASPEKNLPSRWDLATGQNVKWTADLGSQSYGGPVVAGGKVFVGTN
ncbi:MAG TPA: PQQ-binding-like beta-propeller repeat protein, partial [Thermoanaerobaculia bacterium]|nr:PQQ-binding-like beta-propeller repeat protein [Thermoanaerobaculia bacterium]